METKVTALKYRVESCIEQAKVIAKEYPNISRLSYDIDDCDYFVLKQFGVETDNHILISGSVGKVNIVESASASCRVLILLETKKLIVESVVTMEE